MKKYWPLRVAEAVADVLTAYMTVQARQGLSAAYSEYLLYDPIVRVARYRGWEIRSEWPLPKSAPSRGDNRRIDFRIKTSPKARRALLLEVKYSKSISGVINVEKDVAKLQYQLAREASGSRALLVVAGRRKRKTRDSVHDIATKPSFATALYTTVYVGASTTFGVTVFEVMAG
jgi:hypothetical protein